MYHLYHREVSSYNLFGGRKVYQNIDTDIYLWYSQRHHSWVVTEVLGYIDTAVSTQSYWILVTLAYE